MPQRDAPLVYPETATVDHVDDYHGTKVPDPYRWLEDLDATETAAWVAAQNAVTMPFLEAIPQRDPIRRRLTELMDYERVGVPFHRNGRWFVMQNDGLQNQYVLYTMDGPDGERRVLLDPNTWSAEGTTALVSVAVDDQAKHLAYAVAHAGSDWNEWRVLDLETGAETGDVVRWAKFSGASWLPDGSGFLYGRYDEPEGDALEEVNFFQKLYLHRLGTPQAEDRLVYERPDQKEWFFHADITEDGKYLALTVTRGTDPKSAFFFRLVTRSNAIWTELLVDFDARYVFLGNDGGRFYFHTDRDAPNGRVVAVDVDTAGALQWTELIPELPEALDTVTLVGDRFFASYLVDARSVVRVHRLDGSLEGEVPLPGIGTTTGFGGRRSDTSTYFAYTGFTEPGTIFRYDLASRETSLWYRPKVAFDPDQFETRQVFVESRDGTKVPVFLSHRRGIELDGSNPTWLYGYGGFNVPMTPVFSPGIVTWMEMGGVFAQPCLRGGSEYGEEWHLAGTKERKQNVFDDCIAVAEWLASSGHATSDRLVLAGGSNGGLLVGACMTQRPELFAVCLPSRGVLDMLRYEKFTIGWAWASDYGSADNPEEFPALYAYSPLHNLTSGTAYPATLVTTADHDDRVVPSHSFKFISALQAAHDGDAPVLIRIETDAGHGLGTPTAKMIEEAADVRAFVAHLLDIPAPW
ncbi:MAG TPA: prolyl oligopeptidase family serine peptidase [Acidimicrobiales bacterium]